MLSGVKGLKLVMKFITLLILWTEWLIRPSSLSVSGVKYVIRLLLIFLPS